MPVASTTTRARTVTGPRTGSSDPSPDHPPDRAPPHAPDPASVISRRTGVRATATVPYAIAVRTTAIVSRASSTWASYSWTAPVTPSIATDGANRRHSPSRQLTVPRQHAGLTDGEGGGVVQARPLPR